jgi:predicted DNA-binding transcriptional regulator AlpA
MVSNQSFTLPKTGFLRLPDVLKIIPVSRSSWWAGIKTGRYPKGIKLGPRTTAWKVADIEVLLDKLSNDGGEA